jgi:hypothetical protein
MDEALYVTCPRCLGKKQPCNLCWDSPKRHQVLIEVAMEYALRGQDDKDVAAEIHDRHNRTLPKV